MTGKSVSVHNEIMKLELDKIEREYNEINKRRSEETRRMDEKMKKKFITFPFPYMNGILHLGHAYTIIGADVQTRFYESMGYNVMFPFGFGTPAFINGIVIGFDTVVTPQGFAPESVIIYFPGN